MPVKLNTMTPDDYQEHWNNGPYEHELSKWEEDGIPKTIYLEWSLKMRRAFHEWMKFRHTPMTRDYAEKTNATQTHNELFDKVMGIFLDFVENHPEVPARMFRPMMAELVGRYYHIYDHLRRVTPETEYNTINRFVDATLILFAGKTKGESPEKIRAEIALMIEKAQKDLR